MSIDKAYYWIRRAKYHFDTNMTTSGSLHARKLLNKALEELEDSAGNCKVDVIEEKKITEIRRKYCGG